jgi:phosphatidylserine/phosphatidylglycerophosphate/cardiolipin synthase-like enzyme
MRAETTGKSSLHVRAVAGTRVVLMAINLEESARAGLHGFAIKRGVSGSGRPPQWLKGIKYFKDLVADPKKGAEYSSREHPFQSFLWSDYTADPGTEYDFTVIALYGSIGSLEERYSAQLNIKTEQAKDKGHGVWFNRGAIASHALATQFENVHISKEMFNAVDTTGQIVNPEVKWLSRGLVEACISFINEIKPREGLRVCAYEFTYEPVLLALKRALERGVDVQIVYHLTNDVKDQNAQAISSTGLPQKYKGRQILFPRTRTKIPHNKFMVKLVGGKPEELWTGSTNFTDTGFLGQTNVGHLVINPDTARIYLNFWKELSADPPHSEAVANSVKLTPNPPNVIGKKAIVPFFSPRIADNMLDWYGQRIGDSAELAIMTIPFNVAKAILGALGRTLESMRLVILEDPPTSEITAAEIRNKGRLAFSNGAILGKTFIKYKRGGAKVVPITHSKLEDWFVQEELARPVNNGHVFFVHSKLLVIDPLSDDPLVCSGSANFSTGSLESNDENMLLIRGDTRVADIYLTEFDRIFRHFYSRDAINRFAQRGSQDNPLLLDTTSNWIEPNFRDGTYKNNRLLMFFPADRSRQTTWSMKAADDPDPFVGETTRAGAERKKKNEAAKARRDAAKSGTSARKRHPAKKAVTTKKTAGRTSATRSAKKRVSPNQAKKKARPKKNPAAKRTGLKTSLKR